MNEHERKIVGDAASNIRWVKRRLENRSKLECGREIDVLEAQLKVLQGLVENPLDKLEQIEID